MYSRILSKANQWEARQIFWLAFFYVILLALLVQFILLPIVFPQLHAGNGLLEGLDSIAYNKKATLWAAEISSEGWQVWSFRPDWKPLVSITALFYALVAPAPWVLIPLNALLHAIAAAALWSILRAILPKNSLATLGILPIIFFPTSLNWTTQILKDGFTIAGSLLILLAWVRVAGIGKSDRQGRQAAKIILLGYFGAFLVWLVRAYLFVTFTAILGLLFAILLARSILSLSILSLLKKASSGREFFLSLVLLAALYFPIAYVALSPNKSQRTIASFEQISNEESAEDGQNRNSYRKVASNWASTAWLPSQIEDVLKAMSLARLSFSGIKGARSIIDQEVQFFSFQDFANYVPRAVQIMFLAPFPNTWLGEGSSGSTTIMRRISALEMMIAYTSFLFLAMSISQYYRKVEFWLVVLFCGSIMLSQAFVVNNIGTLYRLRYAYFMPFVGLGLASLPSLLASYLKPNKNGAD